MKLRRNVLSISIASALFVCAATCSAYGETAPSTARAEQLNNERGSVHNQDARRNPAQRRNTTKQDTENQNNEQQNSKKQTAKVTQLQAVQVKGIRESLAKSLQIKRDARSIVEAVTAVDLGKFPNTNVAEAMSLVPGVTLTHTFGEGNSVSINGTQPKLNETFLNGHLIAQVPWLYGAAPKRNFDYSILPAEIVGQIKVYKSSQARLPEGSIGGTIIVHTREPLDMKANDFAGSVGLSHNGQAQKSSPNASLLYSWKNADNTFGVAVSGSYFENRIYRVGEEVFFYTKASSMVNVPGILGSRAQVPSQVNAALFQQDRKRKAATVSLQYRPNQSFEVGLRGLYLHENYKNWNQSLRGVVALSPQNVSSLGPAIDGIITNGTVCSDVLSSPCSNPAAARAHASTWYDSNPRRTTVTVKGLDLHAKYSADEWGVSVDSGETKAKDPRNQMYEMRYVYYGGYSFSSLGSAAGDTYDDANAFRDPKNWHVGPVGGVGILSYNLHARLRYAQIDFHNNFDGFINTIQYGVRLNDNEASQIGGNLAAVGAINGTLDDTAADIGPVSYVSGRMGGLGNFSQTQFTHFHNSFDDIIHYVNQKDLVPQASQFINGTWNVKEKTKAGYAQADFGRDRISGNVGLRYVHTQVMSTGYQPTGAPRLPAPADWLKTTTKSYNYVLPSINVTYAGANDWVYRFAAAKDLARPALNAEVNNS